MIGSRSRPMAKVPINDPKYWRERAEEARTVANEMTIPDAKRRTLRIADDYEELARRAERRLKQQQQQQQQQTKWTTQMQSVRCLGLPTTTRNGRDVPSGG